jgi:hypothetical protein
LDDAAILSVYAISNTHENLAVSDAAVFRCQKHLLHTDDGTRPIPNPAAVATAIKSERVRTAEWLIRLVGLVVIGASSLIRDLLDRNASSCFAAVSVGSVEPDGLILWVK